MSQLNSNTAALQEILATVNALPEAGGGSGGAEIETCTLTINCYPDYAAYVSVYGAMVYDGEKISVASGGDLTASQYVIENVICGSIFSVKGGNGGYNPQMSENIRDIRNTASTESILTAFIVNAPAGGNAVFAFTPSA